MFFHRLRQKNPVLPHASQTPDAVISGTNVPAQKKPNNPVWMIDFQSKNLYPDPDFMS
jgi:hypothetical protein